jgi:hypothetical protein
VCCTRDHNNSLPHRLNHVECVRNLDLERVSIFLVSAVQNNKLIISNSDFSNFRIVMFKKILLDFETLQDKETKAKHIQSKQTSD